MKKILLIIIAMPLAFTLQAQTDLLSSGGASEITADGILSWSLGEVAIARASGQTYDLGEGFHHASITIIEMVTSLEDVTEFANLAVFPNPTTAMLNITLPDQKGSVEYNMYGLNGQQSFKGVIPTGQGQQTLDVRTLASGTYILIVTDPENKRQSTFKIIKSN